MRMRRVKAYSSSCSQIILVYLHPFRCNSLFCSQNGQEITKTRIFRVKGFHDTSSHDSSSYDSKLTVATISRVQFHRATLHRASSRYACGIVITRN